MKEIDLSDRAGMLAATIALVAWLTLVIALGNSIWRNADSVQDLLWVLVSFFGFFTILTNTAVALSVTIPLLAPESRLGRFFRRPTVVSGVAASILFVMLAYELLIRGTWEPTGIQRVTDVFLHYLIPSAFVGYWWLVTPMEELSWRDPVLWLSYPISYAIYIVVRGAIIDQYPYPFIDVTEIGHLGFLINSIGVGIGFLFVAYLLVAIGRLNHSVRKSNVFS